MEKTIKDNSTTDNQGVKTDSVQGNDNPSVESTGNDKSVETNIPYARFNEVTKQKKELEAKLKQYEEKQEANRVKALEEQGKYKELNTELTDKVKSYEEKLNVYAEKEAKEREGLLNQLSDDDKNLYGSLSNEALRTHLSKVKEQSVPTNTTQPTKLRGNQDVKEFWNQPKEEQKKNWADMIATYTKKK
jgi:hypothetical protein